MIYRLTSLDRHTEMPPGSFYMRYIGGVQGRWISAGQALVRGGSNYTHAGIILDNDEIIEAEPGGAKIKSVETLFGYHPLFVSDAPMQEALAVIDDPFEAIHFEQWKRAEIAGKARYLEGVPYSYLDYLAIAMAEWKIPGWQLVRNRVESSQHLICSALVDRAYSWAEIHLFDDGRLPGDVTPWDLEQYVEKAEGRRLARLAAEQ